VQIFAINDFHGALEPPTGGNRQNRRALADDRRRSAARAGVDVDALET
jgi:hypothetical protein